MARAIWSGSISFGLVNIPVKLFSAVSRKNVNFNQIDRKTGARVKQKRVSRADGHEVSYEDIVKGYELSSGEYVTSATTNSRRSIPKPCAPIDIEEFVDLVDIDPLFYDSALLPRARRRRRPSRTSCWPRRWRSRRKVGIARFVMRTKQYLAAVRPKDGRLLLSTMVYDDEVVQPDGDRRVRCARQGRASPTRSSRWPSSSSSR